MSDRPRLLFVSPRYLLPADSGGKIRTGDILRGLKGGAFHVTLVSPDAAGAAAHDAGELAALCDRFVSWPERARGPLFHYARLRHLFSRLPIPVATDRSAAGTGVIAGEIAARPDLLLVDFTHAAVLVADAVAMPAILFTHNVEAEIFARHVAVAPSLAHRAIWQNQLDKMRRYERQVLRRFDTVIAVSERDKRQFAEEYGVRAETIPTGVNLDTFAFQPPGRKDPARDIVFTAAMDSYANIDGVQWFMDEVWPLIAAREPQARFTIVGRNPDPGLIRAAERRALPWRFTGFVEEVAPFVHEAAVYVIPLRVGGGTRIKAYEAMALGRPMVSTSIGVEGLHVEAGRHYLRGDDAVSFASAVLQLLRDGELRARLAADARDLVERYFSSASVARAFEAICLDALRRHTPTTAGQRLVS